MTLVAALVAATLLAAPRTGSACCAIVVDGDGNLVPQPAAELLFVAHGEDLSIVVRPRVSIVPTSLLVVVPIAGELDGAPRSVPGELIDRLERFTAPRLVEQRATCGTSNADAAPTDAGTSPTTHASSPFAALRFVSGLEAVHGLAPLLRSEGQTLSVPAATALARYSPNEWHYVIARTDAARLARDADGTSLLPGIAIDVRHAERRIALAAGWSRGESQEVTVFAIGDARAESDGGAFMPTPLALAVDAALDFPMLYSRLFDRVAASTERPNPFVTEFAARVDRCDVCAAPPIETSAWSSLTSVPVPAGAIVTRMHARLAPNDPPEPWAALHDAPAVQGGALADDLSVATMHPRAGEPNDFVTRFVIRRDATRCDGAAPIAWRDAPVTLLQTIGPLWNVPRGRGDVIAEVQTRIEGLTSSGGRRPLGLARAIVPQLAAHAPGAPRANTQRGCGCRASSARPPFGALTFGALVLVRRRRSKRSARRSRIESPDAPE